MPRLPEIFEREQLPESHRHVHDHIMASRGKIANSYAVMLHAPELVQRIVDLATSIRFESSLDRLVLELVALTVCAELDNAYEVGVHAPSARQAGVPAAVIATIESKAPLKNLDEDILRPVRWARELVRTRHLSEQSFAELHDAWGDQGTVEFIGAVGLYSMLSCLQNALEARPQD